MWFGLGELHGTAQAACAVPRHCCAGESTARQLAHAACPLEPSFRPKTPVRPQRCAQAGRCGVTAAVALSAAPLASRPLFSLSARNPAPAAAARAFAVCASCGPRPIPRPAARGGAGDQPQKSHQITRPPHTHARLRAFSRPPRPGASPPPYWSVPVARARRTGAGAGVCSPRQYRNCSPRLLRQPRSTHAAPPPPPHPPHQAHPAHRIVSLSSGGAVISSWLFSFQNPNGHLIAHC